MYAKYNLTVGASLHNQNKITTLCWYFAGRHSGREGKIVHKGSLHTSLAVALVQSVTFSVALVALSCPAPPLQASK